MATKRKFLRHAEADPGAASSPASAPAPTTALTSARSDSATPFSPSSSLCKFVTLHDWWLIKSDTDSGGKRLAVGGLNAHGKYLTRAFTSAPIVKRQDAYTLVTADGITVQIQGFINRNRTHHNGIPLEVSQWFLVGFPFNWEQYANGDFGEMSTSPSVSMRCSGSDKQRENSSDEFPVCVGKLLDSLTSAIDASMNDESGKKVDFAQRNPTFLSSVNTALRNLLSSSSFCSSVASHPVETSRTQEMDKSNANRENGVQCANLTGHDNVGNGLHDGVSGESSAIANDTVAHLPTDMEEKLNDESERISVDVIVEGVSNDLSPEKHHQQTIHTENCAVNCQNLAEIERLQDVSVSQDLPLSSDSVGKDSVSLTGKVTSNSLVPTEKDDSNNKLGRGRYALRSRDHVRKTGVDNAGGSEGSVGRNDSKESYANSMIDKNLPFEPLVKAPNKKGKGYNLRSEAKNEWRSDTGKENYTTLGVFKQCEQIHVQSLVTDGPQESNLLSAKEANSKHHSKTPASPDVIKKKGADNSECNNSLRRSSRSESFKTLVQCSVKHAIHLVHAVRVDSDKASDVTGKRIEKLPNDQDGNQSEALTEAQLTKQRTRNESRQKTVQRPNYSKETPLAQDKREKLSVTSPDLLNLKRSRSGRLLIPPIARWSQVIIYDMDGSITGITDMDGLTTPSKGSRSEPPKKRKLR